MKRCWRLALSLMMLALVASVSALHYRAARSSPAGAPADVAIVQAASWPVPDAEVEALVRQAVALAGGLDGVVDPGDTVVVKPNLVWDAPPDEGFSTDPRVTRTVVQLAREAGAATVLIAEGSACYRDGHVARGATRQAFRVCGHDSDGNMVDDVTGAPLVDLNDAGGLDQHDPTLVRQVTLQNGLIRSSYWLPNVILDADVLIGVPTLKNHSHAGTTLALKNQFGIAPSDIYHSSNSKMYKGALSHSADDLGRHIVDLNLARPLDFVILDGLRGMTDGPNGGTLADPPMRLVLAGLDPVAVDTVGALVMGYDPSTIPYLDWAAGAGLGTDDVSQITVHGLQVSQVRRDFPAPYGSPQALRAEANRPSISITAPSDGRRLLDATIVGASASDDDAIAKVEFYVGDSLEQVDVVPPFETSLDVSAHRGQTVTLRAVAYDRALNDAQDAHTVHVVGNPVPATASFYTATEVIPTYPYTPHLQLHHDGPYPYYTFDWVQYGSPSPVLQEYELLVLENDYLLVTLLPELGGRIRRLVFKPTGHDELYVNPVVKPTHFGPHAYNDNWWLAAGGIEWCLPVVEHGYDFGRPWSTQMVSSTAGITVTLRNTLASDRLQAAVGVHLPADRAYVGIHPRLENPTGTDLDYAYWTNAMLAPGDANTVSADLHFIFSASQMTVHSRGDDYLPNEHQAMSWPEYDGTRYDRLGNWNRWLGFFERPQAAADFVAVYDTAADEGVVRVFPPAVVRGAKGFGMGWSDQLDPVLWTDDGSTYVELHGGVAPTFWDQATLPAGEALEWSEFWYPVSGIGRLSSATGEAALGVQEIDGRFAINVHSTATRADQTTWLAVWDRGTCAQLARWELSPVGPARPATFSLEGGGRSEDDVGVVYADAEQHLLAAANFVDCLPPQAWVEPLTTTVETSTFQVGWTGSDAWSEIGAFDIQVRDGYGGTWTAWLTGTAASSSVFTGTHGHTYYFRARAQDTAGNWGSFTSGEWGQASTTVLNQPATVLVASRKIATPQLFRSDQTVSYTVIVSNTGNQAGPATVADTPPAEMVVLTATLMASSGTAPTFAGGTINWSGVVSAGADVRLTYALSPTAQAFAGLPLTNTAEISGSILGPFTRAAVAIQAHCVWLPLVVR